MWTILRQQRDTAQQGQTLVLFALMSLLLLAGLGLIFDAGLNYQNRRTMQNAADTAALRGARIIAQKKLDVGLCNTVSNPSKCPYILTEVQATALDNGVPNASDVDCDYIDDSGAVLSGCSDTTIPSTATGVKVRVSETHTPLVMRALGIMESGTAAAAAAQVQIMKGMDTLDVPFMVCGVDTALASGGFSNILTTETRHDDTSYDPEFDLTGYDYIAVPDQPNPAQIVAGAYSYDWNVRDGSGNFTSLGGPQYIIYGDNVGRCGFSSDWKGLRYRPATSTRLQLSTTGSIQVAMTKLDGTIGGTGDASPSRSLNGTQGCKASQYPNNCILILPIAHNVPVCPSDCFFTDPVDLEDTTTLSARVWGAFYIEQASSTEYYGRLIKNLPIAYRRSNWLEPQHLCRPGQRHSDPNPIRPAVLLHPAEERCGA